MILIDGEERDTLPASDRGLAYGDGVFRTFPVRGGTAPGWRRHYRKLAADCAALRIACPAESLLAGELARLVRDQTDCVVKITVTRGAGARGYAVPAAPRPTRILASGPLPRYPAEHAVSGVRVHLCRTRLGHQPALAGIKHLNRLENVLARMEWRDPEIAEGLLSDQDGKVVEGTMTNLFALRDNMLFTPDLSRCGVAGVTRERIMELAPRLGLPLRVAAFPLAFLLEAEEVFLCNSVAGIWPVRQIADKVWDQGGLSGRIRRLLDETKD